MVVHGISMGGATTMMVSGEPQPDYVKTLSKFYLGKKEMEKIQLV